MQFFVTAQDTETDQHELKKELAVLNAVVENLNSLTSRWEIMTQQFLAETVEQGWYIPDVYFKSSTYSIIRQKIK